MPQRPPGAGTALPILLTGKPRLYAVSAGKKNRSVSSSSPQCLASSLLVPTSLTLSTVSFPLRKFQVLPGPRGCLTF